MGNMTGEAEAKEPRGEIEKGREVKGRWWL